MAKTLGDFRRFNAHVVTYLETREQGTSEAELLELWRVRRAVFNAFCAEQALGSQEARNRTFPGSIQFGVDAEKKFLELHEWVKEHFPDALAITIQP